MFLFKLTTSMLYTQISNLDSFEYIAEYWQTCKTEKGEPGYKWDCCMGLHEYNVEEALTHFGEKSMCSSFWKYMYR